MGTDWPIPTHLLPYVRADDQIPDWDLSPKLVGEYLDTLRARHAVADKRVREIERARNLREREEYAAAQRDAHYSKDELAGMF